MIVGLTSGCFDLIHFGHIVYLENCKKLCDKLIVGVDCDKMVRKAKGSARPIIPEMERLTLVNNLHPVDSAFIINVLRDLWNISTQFNVDKVFKHEGFKKTDDVVGVTGTRAELVIVPDVPGLVSTTHIIGKILLNYRPD